VAEVRRLRPRRKVLYNLLFVVWPQVSTCGKKEPASNTLKSGAYATGRNSSYAVVPHGDFKILSPFCLCRLRSRIYLKRAHFFYTVYILRRDADHIGCSRDNACSEPNDHYPRHRDNRFFPAAARMPHTREFGKEDGILTDGSP
jgi:hypothetical protein